jgi:hypothetical protein
VSDSEAGSVDADVEAVRAQLATLLGPPGGGWIISPGTCALFLQAHGETIVDALARLAAAVELLEDVLDAYYDGPMEMGEKADAVAGRVSVFLGEVISLAAGAVAPETVSVVGERARYAALLADPDTSESTLLMAERDAAEACGRCGGSGVAAGERLGETTIDLVEDPCSACGGSGEARGVKDKA